MAITDAQVDGMVEKLRVAFGVATTDDLVKEMVNRFLGWKLPKDFAPDAGISFKAEYNEGTPWPARHEPIGTNLFHAGQADEMVRHMLNVPRQIAVDDSFSLDLYEKIAPLKLSDDVAKKVIDIVFWAIEKDAKK